MNQPRYRISAAAVLACVLLVAGVLTTSSALAKAGDHRATSSTTTAATTDRSVARQDRSTRTRVDGDAPARPKRASKSRQLETDLITAVQQLLGWGKGGKKPTATPTTTPTATPTPTPTPTTSDTPTATQTPTVTESPTQTPTQTPTQSPTPTPGPRPGLGVYNGAPSELPDEKTKADFGHYPDVASTYYQSNNTVNLSYESARIRRGTSPNLTITTKGTQLLAQIVAGDATALAWLDKYVASLKQLAQVDPNVPVYATLDHEMKVKVRLGEITGESANPTTYGKALSIFYAKAKAASPNIRTTYWIVGSDRAFEGAVAEAFTKSPDVILFDPYAYTSADTLASITAADLSWIRSQAWYDAQPIGLGEFGMAVTAGDAAMATFFTNVRAKFSALGLAWGVFFNRSRDINTLITNGSYPQAVSAFAASLA